MPPDVLLHLVDPAHWRTALRDGAVAPGPDGSVPLSAPGQVDAHAARHHLGRRDLVLLVVDPVRLPSRLRSGGLPGPLPVTAVVAVVPYRPPAPVVLPAADDALGRALALSTSVPVRRAVGVGDVPGGVAVLDPDFPYSRDNNRLVLTSPVDAATIEETAAEVAGHAGWPDAMVSLRWPGAGDVAAELAGRGWEADELLLMARPGDPAPPGPRGEVVAQREVHELWERGWRADLATLGGRLDVVVAQLVGREQLNDRVVAVTDVVAREDGRVVAAGQLRVDGATAAVESVLTDPAARGRGHADAVLARILDLAAGAGCDLVVLEADAADWPQRWYARRGFEVVGSVWDAVRRT